MVSGTIVKTKPNTEIAENVRPLPSLKLKPVDFRDAKEVLTRIEEYLELCLNSQNPLTKSGLAFYLGRSIPAVYKYSSMIFGVPKETTLMLQRAFLLMEMFVEENLLKGIGVSGNTFWLCSVGGGGWSMRSMWGLVSRV